ncbi:hypothetical protein G6L37_05915 [Agrobacterium rubi]|nr:hypothetical protein [Agrobacterium rubi]NTF24896.1 hypothetical protein [Agrobacterium rubi]
MKYCLSTDVHSLVDGERIVLNQFSQYVRGGDAIRLPAVVGTYHCDKRLREYRYDPLPRDETRPHVLLSDGTRLDVEFSPHEWNNVRFKGKDGYLREPMWTLPLPDVSDDEAIAYVRAFRGEGPDRWMTHGNYLHEPNVVMLIEDIGEAFAQARLICWLDDTLGAYSRLTRVVGDDGVETMVMTDGAFDFLTPQELDEFPAKVEQYWDMALSAYEITLRLDQLPQDVQKRSIVVGSAFTCNFKGDSLVTTVIDPIIAGQVNFDHGGRLLGNWFPRREPPVKDDDGRLVFSHRDHTHVPMATIQDHLKEVARAREKLLPDEALVLVYPPEDDASSSYGPNIAILGMRGANFFEDLGHAQEYIPHSAPDEGGLWVFGNARYWSHRDGWTGEWDGGLDGEWRPATDADLAVFELDRAGVNAEAEANYEDGEAWLPSIKAGTFADEMIAIAESVHAADQKRQDQLRASVRA